MKGPLRRTLRLALALALPIQAFAGHGLNLLGYGAESLGLAGADVALARDSAAVNVNPAGLTQLASSAWDVSLTPYHTLDTGHADDLNDAEINNSIGTVANGGYAMVLASQPKLVAGIGLFAQGGTGFVYEDLNTAYGTRDEASSMFGALKLAAGLGWQLSDRLSLGGTVGLTYATVRQKLFPQTSDADAGFFGYRLDGAKALAANGIIGMQYRVHSGLTFGAAYTSRTRLPLDGATLTVNYESLDRGRVTYRDVRLDGLGLPQEASVGLAWQPRPRWLLVSELKWLDWSQAMRRSRLRASDPDRSDAPVSEIDVSAPLSWRDQAVLALGISYDWDQRTTLSAGIDLENNPIPRETLSPFLNTTQEKEITFGLGRRIGAHWILGSSLQYAFREKNRATGQTPPFGPNSMETYEVVILTASLGRRW